MLPVKPNSMPLFFKPSPRKWPQPFPCMVPLKNNIFEIIVCKDLIDYFETNGSEKRIRASSFGILDAQSFQGLEDAQWKFKAKYTIVLMTELGSSS
jgi:hypothetical protein